MKRKTRLELEKTLMELGISPNLLGFNYICMAVEEIMKCSSSRMCDIYETVACEYQTTWHKVERCIRHSIKKITDAGYRQLGFDFKTNAEFLYSLAFKFRIEEEENEHN